MWARPRICGHGVRSYFYGDNRRRTETILQELDRIDFRVCATELEASVTELRLIHAHKPRHNTRSKPPKASHWVSMTDEAFPRLSITRSAKQGAAATLGPFRRHKTAVRIREAIWGRRSHSTVLGPSRKAVGSLCFQPAGCGLLSVRREPYTTRVRPHHRPGAARHHHHPGSAARTAPGASAEPGRRAPIRRGCLGARSLPGAGQGHRASSGLADSRTGGTNLGRICRWCGLYRQRTTRHRLGAWYRSAAHSHPCSPGGFSSGPGIGGDGGRGPPRVEMAHCQPHQTVGVDVSVDHTPAHPVPELSLAA